jgi:hypothetical protein
MSNKFESLEQTFVNKLTPVGSNQTKKNYAEIINDKIWYLRFKF